MTRTHVNDSDPATVALHALAVSLGDDARATRLLSLTGLSPGQLRERAAEPEILIALLRFLEDHEPDLLAVAGAMGCKPEELVRARIALER